MVALAKRIFVRPKLDEECPEWARDLIPYSKLEHGLGIPYDKIPQETLQELEYFFPMPVPPKRQRRISGKQASKYARTCGLAVFLACLPFALAKQLELFAPEEGMGEVAVLSIRGLSDLAKKVKLSYDRVQRWMAILVALGFIWRFRDGRRTLYVIPLTAYVPRPSAEAVRAKLSALIHSQFLEKIEHDGQVVRVDRDPELTDLLLEVRAKFEVRYQLAPSLDLDLVEDRSWENTLSDIQKALPGLTHEDLYTIVPIVTRHLLAERGTRSGRRFVLRRTGIESTFAIETADHELETSTKPTLLQRGRVQKRISKGEKRSAIESRCDEQDHHEAELSTHAKPEVAEQVDGESRFNQEGLPPTGSSHRALQASSSISDEYVEDQSNLLLSTGDSSPTLSSPASQRSSDKKGTKDDGAASDLDQGAEQRWQKLGEELARILNDQKSVKFYASVFRQAKDEQLVRAVFVKTLHQEQNGGFRKSAGAYFKFMWDQWKVYRTYAAARDKWNHWGNRQDPKGIPPNIHELITLYSSESYTQIAIRMGHWWPEAEQAAWGPAGEGLGARRPSMTKEQAVDLVDALQSKASWYLADPQLYQESEDDPERFGVDALWPDGQTAVFATFDEWLEVHQQMLLLPEEINAWFEAERAQHFQEDEGGISVEEREECVHAALAMYAYRGWNATSFSWEQLVALGRPLVKPVEREEGEAIETQIEDIVLQEGQFYVRVNEELVSAEEYLYLEDAGAKQESLEQDWNYTEEGQCAVLQATYLLGLHISVLRTFGLSVYQQLIASEPDQAECDDVPDTQEVSEEPQHVVPPEKKQARLPGSGIPLAIAWQYLELLTSAVDSRYYEVRWHLGGPGTCYVVVESRLSGQTYVYDCAAKIEQALAGLRVQEVEEVREH